MNETNESKKKKLKKTMYHIYVPLTDIRYIYNLYYT